MYYLPTVVAGEKPPKEVETTSFATNQWSSYDLTLPQTIESDEFEQAWANFLYVLSTQRSATASQALKETMQLSASTPEALDALFALGEKYLYDPNSPMRNDELFIPMLEFMIDSPAVDELLKIRPTALLRMASLNRIGNQANNFTTDSGEELDDIEAPLTLLYFYDPECTDCKRTAAVMSRSTLLQELEKSGTLRIIKTLTEGNTQIDSLYDLKAIPSLYLLDSEKRVMLKDATIETTIQALSNYKQ
ncbi:MAG: DUF5106 domain-containing protein [Rikenellaceae bacterium]